MCSTPFGITGFGTNWRASRLATRRVLNAFRHHWIRHYQMAASGLGVSACSTPFGITGFGTAYYGMCTTCGADVLNAFRHHWIRHTSVVDRRQCCEGAQRLSASLDSARGHRSRGGGVRRVLNAFRHHWIRHNDFQHGQISFQGLACSTPFGITGFGTGFGGIQFDRPGLCSTPFGITGFGTGG